MTCRVTTGNVPTQTAVVPAQPRRDAYFANASTGIQSEPGRHPARVLSAADGFAAAILVDSRIICRVDGICREPYYLAQPACVECGLITAGMPGFSLTTV